MNYLSPGFLILCIAGFTLLLTCFLAILTVIDERVRQKRRKK